MPLIFGTPRANNIAKWIRSKEKDHELRQAAEQECQELNSTLIAKITADGAIITKRSRNLSVPDMWIWQTPISLRKRKHL